jgi:transcriptional regulator with XRE-family HTH domain
MTSQAPHQIRTIVARNIRAARAAKRLTQRELAGMVNGVDTLAVSRWERGTSLPNARNLVALAAALDREPGWFYSDLKEAA